MHLPAFASAVPSPVFRDRKRRGWLLSVVAPGLATIGPLAHTLGATSLWWFAAPLVLFYGARRPASGVDGAAGGVERMLGWLVVSPTLEFDDVATASCADRTTRTLVVDGGATVI